MLSELGPTWQPATSAVESNCGIGKRFERACQRVRRLVTVQKEGLGNGIEAGIEWCC